MTRVIQLEYCVKGFIDRKSNIHIMFNSVRYSWAGGSSMLRDLQKEETSVHLVPPFGQFRWLCPPRLEQEKEGVRFSKIDIRVRSRG